MVTVAIDILTFRSNTFNLTSRQKRFSP